MSIAVSVRIAPSLLLRSLFGLMLVAVALTGLWLLMAPDHALASHGAATVVLALLLWLACALAWWQVRPLWQVRRLEFLADGQLFLHTAGGRRKVLILPGSTLWSWCLMLRLKSPDAGGKVVVVAVMPDSVSADQMRALQVACRWQQARHIDM